jgi:hypothetical protein
MESVYHFVTICVNETSWAHVWRLRSHYLRTGYDTDTLSRKKYCNATFARRMQPELRRENEYLNLGMVNEAKVTMEVESTIETEIREGQLEDAKLKEI